MEVRKLLYLMRLTSKTRPQSFKCGSTNVPQYRRAICVRHTNMVKQGLGYSSTSSPRLLLLLLMFFVGLQRLTG